MQMISQYEKQKVQNGEERILVAGDDEVGRAILLRILTGRGYVIDSISEPRDIMMKLDTANYRLVIIDIIGYEKDPCLLLQGLRSEHPTLSIIVLSDPRVIYSWGNKLKALSDKLLVSPLNPEVLLESLNGLLPSGTPLHKQAMPLNSVPVSLESRSDRHVIEEPVEEPVKAPVNEPVNKEQEIKNLQDTSRTEVAQPETGRTIEEKPISVRSVEYQSVRERPVSREILSDGFERKVLAVGGGKGGVGKSILTANLGAGLAKKGKKVIVVDLDLGGSNLHTYFGIRKLEKGLFDFLLNEDVHLNEVVSPTNIEGLQIIGVTEDYPDAANIKYKRKLRLVDSLKNLDADYVLLDLGSGTDFNVTDFFSITGGGIIVSSTEITSILNTYSFIKSIFYREMAKYFLVNGKSELLEAAKRVTRNDNETRIKSIDDLEKELIKVDSEAGVILSHLKSKIRAKLIVNMVKKSADAKIGDSIKDIVKRYLDIDLDFIGSVTRDSSVEDSVAAMHPFLLGSPFSPAAGCVKNILNRIAYYK